VKKIEMPLMVNGFYNHRTKTVGVNSKETKERQQITFIHEIIHFLEKELNFKLDHYKLHVISCLIYYHFKSDFYNIFSLLEDL
jgi:Zn-dependent peptidase ImmA (M78 family)